MKSIKQSHPKKGFTLFETMLVLIISAIVGISAVKVYTIYESKFQIEEKKSDQARSQAVVSTLLKAELENLGINIPDFNTPLVYPQYVNGGNDIMTYVRAEKYPGDDDPWHSYPPIPLSSDFDPDGGTTVTLRRCLDNKTDCSAANNFDTYVTGANGIATGDLLLMVSNGQQILLNATATASTTPTTYTITVAELGSGNKLSKVISSDTIYFAPVRYQEWDYTVGPPNGKLTMCNPGTTMTSFLGYDPTSNESLSYIVKINLVQLQAINGELTKLTFKNNSTNDLERLVLLESFDSFKVEYSVDVPGSHVAKNNAAGSPKISANFSAADEFDDVWVKEQWPKWDIVYDDNNSGTAQTCDANLSGGAGYSAYIYQNPFCVLSGTLEDSTYCRSGFTRQVYITLATQSAVAGRSTHDLRISADPVNLRNTYGVQLKSTLIAAFNFEKSQSQGGAGNFLPKQFSMYKTNDEDVSGLNEAGFWGTSDLQAKLNSRGVKSAGSAGTNYASITQKAIKIRPPTPDLNQAEAEGMVINREMTINTWINVKQLVNHCGQPPYNGEVACDSTDALNDARPNLWGPYSYNGGGGANFLASYNDVTDGFQAYLRGSTDATVNYYGSLYFRVNRGMNTAGTTAVCDSTDTFDIACIPIPKDPIIEADGWANLTLTAKLSGTPTANPAQDTLGTTTIKLTVRNTKDEIVGTTFTKTLKSAFFAPAAGTPIYLGSDSNDSPQTKYLLKVPLDETKIYREARDNADLQEQDAFQFDYQLKNEIPPFYAVFADNLNSGFMVMRREDL